MLRLYPRLVRTSVGFTEKADLQQKTALQIFEELEFTDLWQDADMASVLAYVKGNTGLRLPLPWKEALPRYL